MDNVLILVRAAEGRRVVTPRGDVVPETPFWVRRTDPYWGRALRAGDLVEVDEKTAVKMGTPVTASPPPSASKKEDKNVGN